MQINTDFFQLLRGDVNHVDPVRDITHNSDFDAQLNSVLLIDAVITLRIAGVLQYLDGFIRASFTRNR